MSMRIPQVEELRSQNDGLENVLISAFETIKFFVINKGQKGKKG